MFNIENEIIFFFKTIMSLGKNIITEIKKNMEDKMYPVDVTKLYFKYKDSINSECKVQVFLEHQKNNIKDQFFTCTSKT